MQGEIGLKIKNIKIRKFADDSYEMSINDVDGSFLYIVGDNNLKQLLEDALNNIKDN